MKDAEHPEWMWGTSISEVDGRYLFLDIVKDTGKVCVRCYLHSPEHLSMPRPEKLALGGRFARKSNWRKHEMGQDCERIRIGIHGVSGCHWTLMETT
jgi:hypothetical protein